MGHPWNGILVFLATLAAVTFALPTSLVADLKSSSSFKSSSDKVKPVAHNVEEYVAPEGSAFHTDKHIAIKRGSNPSSAFGYHRDPSMIPRLSSFLYDNNGNNDDEVELDNDDDVVSSPVKSLNAYVKGYGNRDQLDQHENAILPASKSDLYGTPTLGDYYRFYSGDNGINNRNAYRYKRDTKLTPEEIIRLLSILDYKQQPSSNVAWEQLIDDNGHHGPNYASAFRGSASQRFPANRYGAHASDFLKDVADDDDDDDDNDNDNRRDGGDDDDDDDEQWLQEAVPYPREVEFNDLAASNAYAYPRYRQQQSKRTLYGFANNYSNAFRRSALRKRSRPLGTNGYNYFLSNLLASQPYAADGQAKKRFML